MNCSQSSCVSSMSRQYQAGPTWSVIGVRLPMSFFEYAGPMPLVCVVPGRRTACSASVPSCHCSARPRSLGSSLQDHVPASEMVRAVLFKRDLLGNLLLIPTRRGRRVPRRSYHRLGDPQPPFLVAPALVLALVLVVVLGCFFCAASRTA